MVTNWLPFVGGEENPEPRDMNKIISHIHERNQAGKPLKQNNSFKYGALGTLVGFTPLMFTPLAPLTAATAFTGVLTGGASYANGARKDKNADRAEEYYELEEANAVSLARGAMDGSGIHLYENGEWQERTSLGISENAVIDDVEDGEMYFFRYDEDSEWFELTVYDGEDNRFYGGEMGAGEAEVFMEGETLEESEETVEEAAEYLDDGGWL